MTVEDGFFEVGGDSILGVTVAERMKEDFDCDITVTTLFQYGNIKDISTYIAEIRDTASAPVVEPAQEGACALDPGVGELTGPGAGPARGATSEPLLPPTQHATCRFGPQCARNPRVRVSEAGS